MQLAAVQRDGWAIYSITAPRPMIQAAACRQNPESINWIRPLESINIGLLKAYRDVLDTEHRAWLAKIEADQLYG